MCHVEGMSKVKQADKEAASAEMEASQQKAEELAALTSPVPSCAQANIAAFAAARRVLMRSRLLDS